MPPPTPAGFRWLYEDSGFHLTRTVPAEGDLSVIEGMAG